MECVLLAAESIAALVERLRDERGYTQGQVVEYTNARLERSGDPLRLTREWLSFVETGRIKKPERERLEALAGTLGAPAANLLAAAGYRVAAVEVPVVDPLEQIRQGLIQLERERSGPLDLLGENIKLMFKQSGRDPSAADLAAIERFVQDVLAGKYDGDD